MSDLVKLRTSDPPPTGSAILAKGFRPFFVLAALHALMFVPLWIAVHSGALSVGDYFLPMSWHAHEMVYGYTAAVVAGFLLTAASNWTKRETATGPLLAALCVVWGLGRVAPLVATSLPPLAVAGLSCAFLPLLALVVARAILAAKSRRNYGIVGVVVALSLTQLWTHWGALTGRIEWQLAGPRVGVDVVIVLILVIGGRIIPIFTRNTTKAPNIRNHVALDRASIASALAFTAADVAMLQGPLLGALGALAAVLSLARMVHWGFGPSLKNPLLWVLHLGYVFVPLGFGMRAVAAFIPELGVSTALHLLTAGAIGTLTLGMMTRVSLGHTGRPLQTPKALSVAFALVIAAALLRVVGPLIGGRVAMPMVHSASSLWALAFLIYLIRIAPSLFRPRPDGRPG